MTEIHQYVQDAIDTVAKENPKKWDGSLYEAMMSLEIDCRGDVGEIFLKVALEELGHKVQNDKTTDASAKPWDILVDDDIMLEVKTATQGKNRNFQHESLSIERGYHGLILVDIGSNDVYLTCAAKSTIPFRRPNSLWTKKPKKFHIRNDGRGKWDLTLKDVEDRIVKNLDDIKRHYESMLNDIKGI